MWILILIAIVVAVLAVVAIPIGYRGRFAGGQNTTIIERTRPRDESTDVSTTVTERHERRTTRARHRPTEP